VKVLVRLGILGLAAYGGATLWERYRDVARARRDDLADTAGHWKERVSGVARRAGDELEASARDMRTTTEQAARDARTATEQAADDAREKLTSATPSSRRP
jgi:hypothetical protein